MNDVQNFFEWYVALDAADLEALQVMVTLWNLSDFRQWDDSRD